MSSSADKKIKALDELFNKVGMYRQSSDFRELIGFIKKFPNLSPFNVFLLHVQKPGSQFVATAAEWEERFNRTIKPQARPLVTLQPFGPVRFVFELADTEGEDLFPDALLKPFKVGGTLKKPALENLIGNLPRDGISYHTADHGTGSAGFIRVERKGVIQPVQVKTRDGDKNINLRVLYRLVVNQNHSEEEKFATIAHELGHLYCGHLGRPYIAEQSARRPRIGNRDAQNPSMPDTDTPDKRWWPNRSNLHTNVEEFEAESVAWLVCERAGINNPSAKYLNGYLEENAEIPAISLENVLRAAGTIETMAAKKRPLRKELIV